MSGRSDALCLVRILRQPGDVGAAVDHALADRQHDAHARARGVSHRHLAVEGGGHERRLDAAPHAKAVDLPELWGKRHAADAAVDRLCLRELAELDDGAVDGVQRGRVDVQGLLGLLEGQCAVGGLEALGGALILLCDALRAAKPHHVVFEEGALRLEPSQDLPRKTHKTRVNVLVLVWGSSWERLTALYFSNICATGCMAPVSTSQSS